MNDKELTLDECRVALKALGAYQIRLFDEMVKNPEAGDEIRIESKIVTSAIKKIHKKMEDESKPE